MQLLAITLAASLLGSALAGTIARRDEWQPPIYCFYMTSDYNWGGDNKNMCAPAMTCSKLSNRQTGRPSLPNNPQHR
jgi:hypothetical protein